MGFPLTRRKILAMLEAGSITRTEAKELLVAASESWRDVYSAIAFVIWMFLLGYYSLLALAGWIGR